mgnify:FL=1
MGQVKYTAKPPEPDHYLRYLIDASYGLQLIAREMSVAELSAPDINEQLDDCEKWLNAIRAKQEDRDA